MHLKINALTALLLNIRSGGDTSNYFPEN